MPGLPDKVEVESESPRMGALRRGVQFLTVATALLSNCLGRFLDQPSGSLATNPETGLPYGTSANIATSPTTFSDWSLIEETCTTNTHDTRGTSGDARADEQPGGARGLHPMEPSQRRPRPQRPGARVRGGLLKRLSGNLERTSRVLQTERKIYDDLPAAKDVPRIDIMEMFAGNAEITHLAPRYDLKALQPFDIKYGIDLLKKSNRDLWKQSQDKYKPLAVVVETDCNPWNIFNENLNYAGRNRMDQLQRLRAVHRPLVKLGVDACWKQIMDGNYFLMENPQGSRFWELPEVQELMVRDDVYLVRGHSGAYGGTNSNGDPIKKTYQWLTNSKELADAVSRKLDQDQLRECVPLVGEEVGLSATYPTRLCQAILRAIRSEAKKRCPQRFLKVHEIYYQEPVQDPAARGEILQDTKNIFSTTTTKALNLSDTDRLYSKISQLVPWEIVRIQITRTPVVRRIPKDIDFTHRGAAIEYHDGLIEIESEPLDGLHFPRQRFKRAVAFAVLWYGYGDPLEAKEQPAAQQPDEDKPKPAPVTFSTVTFPGCPADVPQDTLAAVRRLHLNLGHPTEKELLRLLAWQGAVSKQMISAVKHMQCASCQRTKKHQQPRPSSMPVANIGQFNDNLQSDVFYCRDVLGVNHAVVGIIDQSTLLHQATRMPDTGSETMLDIFRNIWFKPYGYPLTIRVDPGAPYAKHFRDYVERRGIFLEVVPAEAHWRIGLIERRNAVLRDILERIIDAEAVMTFEDFDMALESAVRALNSMTYSHGRPPYMAVFGQIPRVGGGLLQDDRSLVTHDPGQGAIRADILRADAMKALAEINTSQSLRRALLRKTATPHHNQLLPGQNCAYWRWQNPRGRSTKKRGAWVVARFLSYDPDGRSAWLHSGTTTLQVSLEQLRAAYGFEQWQPSIEDIKALRDASSNIRQDLWQDHRSSAPPRDEDGYDYPLEDLPQPTTTYTDSPTPQPILPLAPPPLQPQTTAPPDASASIQLPQATTQVNTHAQQYDLQQQHNTTTEHINIFSPTHIQINTAQADQTTQQPRSTTQAVTDLDYNPQRFGLTRRARSRTPTNRAPRTPRNRATSQPATPRAAPDATHHTADTPSNQQQSKQQQDYESAPYEIPYEHQEAGTLVPDTAETPVLPHQHAIQTDTAEAAGEVPPLTPLTPPTPVSTPSQEPPVPQHLPLSHLQATGSQPSSIQPTNIQPSLTRQQQITEIETIDLTADEPLPQLPQKRTYQALLNQIHGKIEPPHHSWDGSPDTHIHNCNHSTLFTKPTTQLLQQEGYAVLETDLTAMQSESDASNTSDEDKQKQPAERLLSRKEAKALEREIPWRNILKLPQDQIDAYIESAKKEEKSWFSWGSIEEVSAETAAKILANPVTKKRVLRSRACYRNKSKIPGKLQAKTRVVALGHLDPDLASLSRDSPTPTRTSEYILLAVYIAGKNGIMENDPARWTLWAGDVSTAFLQGAQDKSERPEDLFLLPPQDQVTKMAKTFSAPLYRVKGNIYGLASAPRTWYREVCRRLKSIDFTQHSLDHLLFYKRIGDKLMAICIVYVDDVLLAHREDYKKEEFYDLFKWGSEKELTLTESLEFKGKEINLIENDGKFNLKVTQKRFIKNTEPGKVARGRIAEGPPLTPEEQTEFRSVTGSIQWLAGQTRPEVAAWVSLANKGKDTAPADLAQLYQTLDYIRENPNAGLLFQDVAVNKATTIIGYADSSWANAAKCASQQGSIVMMTTPHCTQVPTKANVIDWRSNRSSRICRSTLAAEAIACDDCVDRAYFVNVTLAEILTGVPPHKDPEKWKLQQLQVTDCRSLFDAVSAENPRTTEKRTYVDIRSIQEFIGVETIFWTPTQLMFADGLTKSTKALREAFAKWLQRPYVQLKETSTKESIMGDNFKHLES